MKSRLKLGLILFALGFLGVLSLLTATIPLPDEFAELSPAISNILILLNPTLMLLISVVIGTILYDKVNLTVPVISSLLKKENATPIFVQQLKYGIPLGLLAGTVIVVVAWVFNMIIPHEFEALGSLEVTLLVRFGYGGITEELLLRFGVMTLLVWIMSKLIKKLNNPIYWIAIVISTLLFALGHFPVAFAAISAPSLTLLTYILIGNSVGGLVYGWLYWKKGLEAAIIAHIFTHVAIVLGTIA
ncbi:MAG: CPBP family intramembrane metalloprotease [Chitinispirillales bacterium]|jgi:membrane protease YdiL (CAAX protease family)|nr:CPBP family intramembrane metalloprotease [Chitinispirillales bacterium]